MEKEQGISLETLGQGAAVERFNIALQEVLDNIQDPNTEPKKTREVTLKATFKPSEDRAVGDIIISVIPKLAPLTPYGTRVFMGRAADGSGMATEHNAAQTGLFDKSQQGDNVKPFPGKEEAAK